MKLTDRLSIHNFVIYWLVLLLGFVCVSCSSKSDEEKKDQKAPSPIVSEEEVERLKQEDDELKKALAEAIGRKEQIASEEEVQRLKQEVENLKRALAEASDRKEQEQIASKSPNDRKEQSRRYYKDRDKVDTIIAEFKSAVNAKRKVELIESLSELSFGRDPSVISFVQEALDEPEPEVRRAAIELLEDYESTEILPVITQALKDEDEQIREEALMALSGVNDPQVGELLAQALSDTSKNVRTAALEVAEEHKDSIKLRVMEEGISSQYNDVKYEVASMLEDKGDHRAVEILIEGLKDNNSDFRDEINEALYFLIDEEFETYEEAQAWWVENKDNYDDELFLIEDD